MNDSEKKTTCFFPLLMAATYLVSRLLFHAMGIRFDASGLDWYWQYLDTDLLRNDLLRSVFYQHSQPPLFNLFLGIVLKLFPESFITAFAVFYRACSLALYFLLFRILCLIRFRPWIAYLAASLFIFLPGVVLYENWLFYTWPTAVMLTFAAYQLLLFQKTRRSVSALLYMSAICAVCLTRSMFHLGYLVAAVAPLLLTASPARKRIGSAAAVAVLLVGSLFLKNLLLFGFFGSSSWMGMNLWKVVPTGGKSGLLTQSAVALIEPFSPIREYPDSFRQVPDSFSAVPALAAECKQNGRPNLNHFGYIAISDAFKNKAVELITADIPGYAGIVLQAWGTYFAPAQSYPLLPPANIAALKGYSRVLTRAGARLFVPAGFLLIVLYLPAGIASRGGFRAPSEARWFFLFCAGTVLYIALVGNLLEHGENMRFRVQTDPLLYLAVLYAVNQLRIRLLNR